MTAVAMTCGALTVGEASAQQRRDGNLMPQNQGGMITVAGCLMRGNQVRGGDNDNYALANPRRGPVSSVPQGTCSADPGAPALDLKDGKSHGLSDAMVGRWVEITGDLEKETSKDPDNLREIEVKTGKLVPVVVPRAEAPAPAPAPQVARTAPPPAPEPRPVAPEPEPPPAPAPAPVAHSLPKTASDVPMIGLMGLLAFAGAFALRRLRFSQPS